MTLRVLVVDDHPFYREGIKTLLAPSSDRVAIVGEASSGEQAIELAAFLSPDVVLMDLQMPGIGGIEATVRIAEDPGIAVLILTMIDDDSVLPALAAGARGYLLKDAGIDDVLRAIEAVAAGQIVLAHQAADRVQQRLAQPRPVRVFPQLTDREHALLAELIRGRSTAEVSRTLGLSEKTVRNYVSNVLAKVGARDRGHLVAMARQAGYED